MVRGTWLAALLPLAVGCSSNQTAPSSTCSEDAMAEAQAQSAAALSGNTSCDAGDDCVLVSTPCKLATACGFDLAGVNLAGQAAVEHAFSVTAAEVCGNCTPQLTDTVIDTDGCTDTPGATCVAGQCAVVSFPPDAGSFEWDCVPVCFPGDYCEIENALTACPGAAEHFVITRPGECLLSTSFSESCGADDQCGLFWSCWGADGGSPVCEAACPAQAQQPMTCRSDCELASNNHGCAICFCPNGCPLPDAG